MKITLDSFKPASQISPNEAVTAIFYGNNGTGKTAFAAAAPNPLIIDVGRSKKTLLTDWWRKRNPGIDPIIVSITEKVGRLGAPDAAEAFDAVCDAIDMAIKEIPHRFDTVVIDEATALGYAARTKAIYFNAKAETGGKPKSNTKDSLERDNIMSAAVQDYGAEMSLMEQFLRGYSDICLQHGKHLILIAHESPIYGKPPAIGLPAPITGVEPGFTGKRSAQTMCAMVDWVFRFETVAASGGAQNYRIRTLGDENTPAKCRHAGVFQNVEKATSFTDFLNRVKGNNATPNPASA